MSGDQRAPEAADLSAASTLLVEGELQVVGQMPNASNATFLSRCVGPAGEVLAIYKPARGEAPLWDFPEGTLHLREVAAYVVAGALGWPNVPETVLRDGPFGPGSVQRFVRFDPEQHYFTLGEERADDFRLIALFDLVVNNADRKGGHCLLGEDGRIWVIDHGVCFASEPKLRTVIWDFIGEPFPVAARAGLEALAADLRATGPARAALADLLAPDEIEALEGRLAGVLEGWTFPEPEEGVRPFPWPPL